MREPDELRSQDPVEELLAAYALNAVEPHERAVVELVLAQDERYRDMLAQYLEAAATLSGTYAPQVPSPALRQRVLDTIRFRPAGLGGSRRDGGGTLIERVLPRLWAAAGVLLVVVVGLIGYGVYQQGRVEGLEDQLASTEQLVLRQEGTLATIRSDQQMLAGQVLAEIGWTQEQLDLARKALYWAALPGVETVVLEPVEPIEETTGTIPRAMLMITPDRQAGLLIAVGLAPLAQEAAYQAWLWHKDGTPVNGLVFTPDPTGYAQVFMPIGEDLAAYKGMTISMEPDGGSATPQGPSVLGGSMAMFSH